MPRMLHRPGAPAAGQKVMLATPAYGGLEPGYTFALYHSSAALADAGIAAELAIFAGDCHVDDSRNRLVRQFLLSDCTDLVFLDADLRWEPADLVALCQYGRDVVAATYPLKQDDEAFPVRFIDGEIWSDEEGLIEVDAVPTGFLRMRRTVLEHLAAGAKQYFGKADNDTSTPLIFERTLEGSVRWGGDYTFCRKWRATGGSIWLMPEAQMEHTGSRDWAGSAGSFLRRNSGIAIEAGLDAIGRGKETPEVLAEMIVAWGNPWSVGADFLGVAIMLAREAKGPILECGSGLTTLVMAAANPGVDVWALEHDPSWQQSVVAKARGMTNLRLCHAPLMDGWYTLPPDLPSRFSFALVDGPPRDLSDRAGVFRIEADTWLLDDMNSPAMADAVDQLCAERGMAKIQAGKRPFAIVHKADKARNAA